MCILGVNFNNSFVTFTFIHNRDKCTFSFQEVRKYLKECIQIFSFEPTCIQEGRLAAIARLDLVELETFVDSVDKSSSVAATAGNIVTN